MTARPTQPHAVARLRTERLARAVKPFRVRGGPAARCPDCRVMPSHCLCHLRPVVPTHAGMCLLMADIEPLKPSNTGWLIADVVADTFAFGWARTAVDPALLTLLADPQWQAYVVFPGEFVTPERVRTALLPPEPFTPKDADCTQPGHQTTLKRPLFVLLDATWSEAGKMFRKSPYLNHLPVLSLHPDHSSAYRLRRSSRGDHFCTSEVGALCLALAGETHAAQVLTVYLEVFTQHYVQAKNQQPVDMTDAAHQHLRNLQLGDNLPSDNVFNTQ
ncbi:tRNA-uridine aminocarboxypropyltransferase [Rhodoferax sp.]|uniref:tRNA-uridine aminocarboxypropyltransferase n=1 Tax=Rhodoferax sp. TaxID=50421 RepID=UPI0026244E6D|nr:tRNA-uridine aminocarboxypropyltransferase [Rhodoferax sp.]MDD2809130.1 DTW domain-containing protein [Rhodoferax sp.]MDD4944766.1 DTW domain-containing protein [Rhodoferax sp.]